MRAISGIRAWGRAGLRGLVVAASLAAFAGVARAEGDPAYGFGLGIMVGEPTGINGKMWTSPENAIVGGAAWSFSENGEFALHGDYLWHKFTLLNVEKGKLPLYFGVGARMQMRDNADDRFGVRIPVGLDYLFADAPVDIFIEFVPILDLTPDTEMRLNAALGARFFF